MNQPRIARDRVDRLFAVVRRMGRFFWPALLLFVVGGGASYAWATLRKPTFKSETVVLYRDPEGARLQETALSRTRLEQIITSARLYGGIIADRGMADAVDEMRRHIRLRPQGDDTFVLSFDDSNAARARDVTAQLADTLVVDNARTPEPPPQAANEAFARERARLEGELKQKEAALAQFAAKHPEFSKEARAATARPQPRQPMKNDSTLTMLEREVARLKERLAQPTGNAPKEEPQPDPELVTAKQTADAELAFAQKDLADKQTKLTDEHPDVRAARERVQAAQTKVEHAADAVAASLAAARERVSRQEDEGYIDRGALENQLKRINDEIADYKRRKAENAAPTTVIASSVVAQEAEWTRLNRELSDVHDRMAVLRDQEARAAKAEPPPPPKTAQVAVIEPAFLPSHEEAPDRTEVLVAGIAASLLLSLLLALGLALLDDHIYDRVDIERLGVPLLGVVPRRAPGKKAVSHG